MLIFLFDLEFRKINYIQLANITLLCLHNRITKSIEKKIN